MTKRKKQPPTPRSFVVHALRLLWLHSRERRAALEREHYTCEDCNRKQTKAKGREFRVQVHHILGIDWHGLADMIISRLLPHPNFLAVLCDECHDKRHKEEDTAP